MSPTDRLHREDGVALVFALLAVVVLAGLAVLFVARAVTESRATGKEQRFETAIHVSEAGVDDVIERLNEKFTYVTRPDGTYWDSSDPASIGTAHEFTPDLNAAESAQHAWAVNVARTSCTTSTVPTGVGEACGIRPHKGGSALPFVFGVSFVPNRADPVSTRVVKVQIAEGRFSPSKAIVTNGPITEFKITICGDRRDVHSNSTIDVKKEADTVTPGTQADGCPENGSGDVTSTGTFTRHADADIGPGSGQTSSREFVPHVNAREIYRDYAQPNFANWHDLCVSSSGVATVRRPAFDASGNPAPCTGTVLWTQGVSATPHYNGWRYESVSTVKLVDGREFVCDPCWRAGGGGGGSTPRTLLDGIYYAHGKNATLQGDLRREAQVTILAQSTGAITPHPQSGGSCAETGTRNGNVGIFGTGGWAIRPFPGAPSGGSGAFDLVFLADRDIAMGGNVSSGVHGVMAAHEQIQLKGNPDIHGAAIAEDACDSSASPVMTNVMTGSFRLTHSQTLLTPFDAVTHITAWNELKRN